MTETGTDRAHRAAVFISYVQADNENNKKRITNWFHKELRRLVNARLLEDIEFFKDTEDIGWGEDWEKRIRESVDSVKLFMPIITTRYFVRPWTRQELQWFLDHERSLGRDDLILPIYFMDCEQFEALVEAGDELARALQRHQMVDLRKVRKRMVNPQARERQVEELADRLVEALKRIGAAEVGVPVAPVQQSASSAGTGKGKAPCEPASAEEAAERAEDGVKRHAEDVAEQVGAGRAAPIAVGEGGDYAAFADAVANAPAGSEIVLKPGLHEGGVTLDRPLHIRGEGRRDAVITAEDAPAIVCESATGSIANVTIRRTGSGEVAAVEVRAGRPEIEDCTIESEGSGILACNAGDPQVRRCLIRGGSENGIEIVDDARGTYSENEIADTVAPGIGMQTSKSPVVRANRIHGCQDAAILVLGGGGEPLIEDNEIFENATAGLYVSEGASFVARNNQFHDGREAGVVITGGSAGTLEGNEISGSTTVGIAIDAGSTPVVRRNRISGGSNVGVYVHDDGGGTIEDNDIFGNQEGGVWISDGAGPSVHRNRIHDHPSSGVIVREGGTGVLEDNEVWANGGPGVYIQVGGNPAVRGNRIRDGGHAGVYVEEGAGGELDSNDIFGNEGAGVVISAGADPTVHDNQIHDGKDVGVFVREGGLGTVVGNEIFGNAGGGVWVDGATPVVRANDIRDNEGHGVLVSNAAGTFEDNMIHGNAVAGISITAEADPMIVRNRIYGGRGPGIMVADSGRGTIVENWIFSNASDGIAIVLGGSPVVRRNAIYDGADTGIFVSKGGTGQIEENDIYGNSRAGVWIQEGGNPTLVSNKIHDHPQNGVVVVQGGLGTLHGNQVFQNVGVGVLVGTDCDPVVQENWILRNGGVGLSVLDGRGATIRANHLLDNYGGPLATADASLYQHYLQANAD
ncbi:MAG TPA: right-handed parallel beta-helix repeat-containing protein [Gaiellaceae bacterium]